ncbi:MAG: hypothetical protein KKE17_14085 [Proteobacteria bacterium]|nr:hypothetical protein [Pseudomonadota bacterium]MBU1711129.1 hypothetical protein [Pseudomonadota bacterium]
MKKQLSWFDRLMLQITFAEGNDHESALDFMNTAPQKGPEKQKDYSANNNNLTEILHSAG